jgi:hypothetical protein
VIRDYKYGSACNIGQSVDFQRNKIIGNTIYNGTGLDSDVTWVLGIENWGMYTTIANNHIYQMAGVAIDNGGKYCLVANNHCYNISQDLTHPAYAAINSRYSNASINASYSNYVGNAVYDTQGSPTMSFGYTEQSALLTGIRLSGNQIYNGISGNYNILSSSTVLDGALGQVSAVYDPGNLVDGAGATTTATVTGAALGDLVVSSFSLDLQGIMMSAWVSSADTVSIRFQNETGGAIDLGSGTLRVRVFPQVQ